MDNIVIGIEGTVGAGKTSICRNIVKIIPQSVLLNGGNLYRTIVYAMMKNGKKLEVLKKESFNIDIKKAMDFFNVEIRIENNETNFYIDGVYIDEEKLQSKESSLAVSEVGGKADNRALFEFARELINSLKKNYNVIISGRSIMEIYPSLDYHFFITASLEERIKRKGIQYKGNVDYEELRQNVIKRDELQEKAGFYKIYDKTIQVDVTDCKTVEESTDKVLKSMKSVEIFRDNVN